MNKNIKISGKILPRYSEIISEEALKFIEEIHELFGAAKTAQLPAAWRAGTYATMTFFRAKDEERAEDDDETDGLAVANDCEYRDIFSEPDPADEDKEEKFPIEDSWIALTAAKVQDRSWVDALVRFSPGLSKHGKHP